MSRGKEIVAIALALIGWITAVVACVLPMWKVSAVTEAGTGRAQIWEGLWMSCVTKSTGQRQCKVYDSMQDLPSDLQAARDMTVIAIITALLPLTLSFMGAKYTNCTKDKALKAKVMMISCVFFIIAGVLVLISVSGPSHTIVQDFWKVPSAQRRELGASLYTGFAAAALLIIGGVLLCCPCPSWEQRARTSTSRHHTKGMKIVGIVLCLIGWILAVVTCVLPMWKVTAFIGANIVTAQIIWEGLWMSCVVQSTGQMQCKIYDSLLALTSDLQAARAMTVMSIITALLALALSIMGLKCTTCIKGKALKTGVMMIYGVFFIIAGILMLIPVSWSTNTIIQYFYNPLVPSSQHRELGAALYIGFTAATLLILGGGLLCCHCVAQKKK